MTAGAATVIFVAFVIGLVGVLAFFQAYYIGKCFKAGQPQENGPQMTDCLV